MDQVLGIAADHVGWSDRFAEFATALDIEYEVFIIERGNWLDTVDRFSGILWRPNLDPPFCEEAKEKIYFLESCLGKRVFPNWATFWHYDNKRAQSYMLGWAGVAIPETFVCFCKEDAREAVRRLRFPLVSKTAGGAASEFVRLLRDPAEADAEIRCAFKESVAEKVLRKLGVWVAKRRSAPKRYVLWQEFIDQNARDLRITVIGKRDVFAFWRNNRPGDFRASGSGRMDYSVDGCLEEMSMCVDLCRRLDFDSMAFDIVYRKSEAVVVEMSYTFNDQAIYDCPGHYWADEAGAMTYHEGHEWPQRAYLRHVQRTLSGLGSAESPTRTLS